MRRNEEENKLSLGGGQVAVFKQEKGLSISWRVEMSKHKGQVATCGIYADSRRPQKLTNYSRSKVCQKRPEDKKRLCAVRDHTNQSADSTQ